MGTCHSNILLFEIRIQHCMSRLLSLFHVCINNNIKYWVRKIPYFCTFATPFELDVKNTKPLSSLLYIFGRSQEPAAPSIQSSVARPKRLGEVDTKWKKKYPPTQLSVSVFFALWFFEFPTWPTNSSLMSLFWTDILLLINCRTRRTNCSLLIFGFPW